MRARVKTVASQRDEGGFQEMPERKGLLHGPGWRRKCEWGKRVNGLMEAQPDSGERKVTQQHKHRSHSFLPPSPMLRCALSGTKVKKELEARSARLTSV